MKLTSLEFDLQRSAAIRTLRAVDEGEVFLAQGLDEPVDVVERTVLATIGIPSFRRRTLVKAFESLTGRSQFSEPWPSSAVSSRPHLTGLPTLKR